MKPIFTLLVAFVSLSAAKAQLIQATPYFPSQSGPVTVTFNTAEGNKGLMGYADDIYVHTGVITNTSSGPSDWKYVKTSWGQNTPDTKLTKIGTDLYQLVISSSIEAYYGLPNGTKVTQLAFVLRSGVQVNGAYKEGKTSTGGDIFWDVYDPTQGLKTLLISPTESKFIAESGDIVKVQGAASLPVDLRLLLNGQEIKSLAGAKDLSHDITVGGAGNYKVDFIATNSSGFADTNSFSYVVLPPLSVGAIPAGSKLGLNRLGGNQYRLVLEAPGKSSVMIIGDMSNWELDINYLMSKDVNGRLFWKDITLSGPEDYQRYQYLVDGKLLVADPLSELVLDPFNDGFISPSVFTGLPAYPAGRTSGNVTAFKTGSVDYPWQATDFQRPAKTDLVIYELLPRDFLEDHSYSSLTDSLDYLLKLGVNAIELMPPNEFEGNISWGYNISFHNAIDKYYGDPDKLKAFIDAAHQRGIAVIFDVVFNHAFGQSPLSQLYFDAANNRPAADNPWLNPTAKHPFNVGYDFNHESQSTKDYMDRCLNRMIEEFKVDGFRFDLSKGFTQKFNTDVGAWGAYDASRIALLERVADVIWAHAPDIYVILEHLGDNSEEKELAAYGMMLWGNMNHVYNEATMGYPADLSWASYKARGWAEPMLVTYMESHDEERLMYKNVIYGNSSGDYSVKQPGVAVDRLEMGAALFYTIPGPKMIWQFGELAYDYSINYCENGTINNDCRTAPKPIRWDYLSNVDRLDLLNVHADLIDLKKKMPAFKSTDFQANINAYLKTIVLKDPDADAVVYANANVSEGTVNGVFTKTGTWYEYFSGAAIQVDNLAMPIVLKPGEYRLYLSKNYPRPTDNDFVVSAKDYDLGVAVKLFPNPANGRSRLELLAEQESLLKLSIYNSSGQLLRELPALKLSAGRVEQVDIDLEAAGLFFVRISDGHASRLVRLINH